MLISVFQVSCTPSKSLAEKYYEKRHLFVTRVSHERDIKQHDKINGFNWWQSRDDVGGVGKNLRVKLYYYSGIYGSRWRIEGAQYSLWASNDIISNSDPTGRISPKRKGWIGKFTGALSTAPILPQ